MAIEVTVALVGVPNAPEKGLRYPDDWEIPYDDRPKIELFVDEDESLGSVLLRAAEKFGVVWPDWGVRELDLVTRIDFYEPGREFELGKELVLVDSEGHAEWTWRWTEIPYRRLIDAKAAGVFLGDPHFPYLVLQPGIGNGLLADFTTLLELWDFLWNVGAEELLKAFGLAEIARRALARARRAGPTIESRYEAWKRNGARPETMQKFLADHAWDAEHLGRVLGCSAEHGEGLLLGLGHAKGEDGLWRPGEDEESKFLQETLHLVIHAPAVQREHLRELMEERLRQLSERGEAPGLDWSAIGQLPEDLTVYEEISDRMQCDSEPGREEDEGKSDR